MTAQDDPAAELTRLLHAVDVQDWAEVRARFADRVRIDYTDLSGGEPETLDADELITRWQALLPGFDATQHMTGPSLVSGDGDGTRVDAHVRGYHHLADAEGGPIWGVHGHYVVRLARVDDGWRITDLTLRVFYQEGNTKLPELATERAASSPRPQGRPA